MLSGGSNGKASAYSAGDRGPIPGLGRSSGEGNGTPLQYSCLENPMDGAWWATVHGVAKSQTRLIHFTFSFFCARPWRDSYSESSHAYVFQVRYSLLDSMDTSYFDFQH